MANKNFRLVKRPPGATIQHKRVRSEVLKRLDQLLDSHVRARQRWMSTWENSEDIPDFPIRVEVSPTKIRAWIELEAPDAPSARISVYRMLDVGTAVRPMIMSPDFQAKTSPGVKTSRAGRGGPAYLSPSNPAEGIGARHIDDTINEDLEKTADKLINQGYRAGAKKLGRL